MTNNLPEVGKIYISKITKQKIKVVSIDKEWNDIVYEYHDKEVGRKDFKDFFNYFKLLDMNYD